MITMRSRNVETVLVVLLLLSMSSCWSGGKTPVVTNMVIDSGNCTGCLLGSGDGLSSFVVLTDTDYETMMTKCDHIREERLPPRPGRTEILVYVSREGSGCKGCLDIRRFRETHQEIIVEVEGGFQGACEMLITLGAWALLPKTNKPVKFAFREVLCPE